MANLVKKMAVKTVKPLVGDRAWARLRGGPSSAQSSAQSAATKPAAARPKAPAAKKAAPQAKAEPELTEQQQRRRALRAMSLTELALEFGTDKAGLHHYTEHYERHLGHLRSTAFTMLEVGIGGYRTRGLGGESLRMWKWFFPKAQVVGLDIADKSWVRGDRISIYQGSQDDEAVLRRIVEEKGPLQVVIDDGSHRPEHIRETFRILFPLIADDGIYVIEDTQTSYWPEFGGDEDLHARDTTIALVKDLVDGLHFEEYVDETYVPTYTDEHVVSVTTYHNLVFIQKGDNREGTNRRSVLTQRYADQP